MLGAEIDFIVLEYDSISNIAIASRIEAMELRSSIEIPKLKVNDTIKIRIIAVGVKHILVDMYGKEVIIKAQNLKHIYIVNCKDIYKVGAYLRVKIRKLDNEKNTSLLDRWRCILNIFLTGHATFLWYLSSIIIRLIINAKVNNF